MTQRLESGPIPDCASANSHFANNPGLVVAMPQNRGLLPFLMIPEGYYALVANKGALIDYTGAKGTSKVWPAGFHRASIFTYVSHLVTKNNVVFDAPVKGCKTSDNVTVVLL